MQYKHSSNAYNYNSNVYKKLTKSKPLDIWKKILNNLVCFSECDPKGDGYCVHISFTVYILGCARKTWSTRKWLEDPLNFFEINKLTKFKDAIAISKSETITHSLTHSLTDRGRC